ncbi:hypothetical protein HDC36_001779 [Xanthomonas sp. JAI131]|uniref:hypothetical protein n=1 Tax=Xanthomonas sp. JAI131 TaxID=2723067 RepID=UPI0015CA7DA5|nr:hypothetical protein [Xanthomonas sp. JAI131]NYF20318.1 hypothetical protein [Xanthomonas sp. JAI131]
MDSILIVATILGGIAAIGYFWDKIKEIFGGRGKANQHDIDLYRQYRELIVDSGVADFYRSHDFLGAFKNSYWSPFSRYVDSWGTVDHKFIDSRLNKAHEKVYKTASELGMAIAKNTVSAGATGHLRSVKPDSLPAGPTPEHIKAEAREINLLVPCFTRAHEKFVRLANRRLRGIVA